MWSVRVQRSSASYIPGWFCYRPPTSDLQSMSLRVRRALEEDRGGRSLSPDGFAN